jgi:dihydroorotate dehydrogenase electron transfer subunit
MNLVRARVTEREMIMPETYVVRLDSRELAQASPGQFVHLRTSDNWDPLLRRPMSIYLIHAEGVSVMIRDVGRGSSLLAEKRPGDLVDVLGPLGRPFELRDGPRRLLMVGGGYGVAPLIGLAERALPRGLEITLLVGAATADHVFPGERVPKAVNYRPATVDGSLGHRGFVTGMLPEYLDWADAVFACGPTGMLDAVHRAAAGRAGLDVQVSMEQQMGCAMGVCLGCVIPTSAGYERVCRDGPVFDSNRVHWGAWNGL